MSTITNSGEDAIMRSEPVEMAEISSSSSDLLSSFEIARTARDILTGGYSKIALQFPDNLLHHSVTVYKALSANLPPSHKVYILADTTYNSCCIDEVAAQHVDADVIVHYGHACLEPPARLPVIYVFGKMALDVDRCVEALAKSVSDKRSHNDTLNTSLITTDVAYAWKAQTITNGLAKRLDDVAVHMQNPPPTIVYPAADSGAPAAVRPGDETKLQDHEADGSALPGEREEGGEKEGCCGGVCKQSKEESKEGSNSSTPNNTLSCCNGASNCDSSRGTNEPSNNISIAQRPVTTTQTLSTSSTQLTPSTILIYIGSPSLKLTNLVLTHKDVFILAYDPVTDTCIDATGSENRLLQRRYAQVNKARDCDVFGLAVGTLSTASYLPLVQKLRAKLQHYQKKVYTVAVGKLNPAKLGNFAEIQTWCVIACGENSIVNSKEFHVPVITPFELEMALDNRLWTGEYVLDFGSLLDPRSKYSLDGGIENGAENDDDDDDSIEKDPDAPIFSASTGRFIHHRKFGDDTHPDTPASLASNVDALTLRTTENALQVMPNSAAGAYLQTQRSWKGLEVREGEDAPSELESGRAGVARGYTLPDNLEQKGSESATRRDKDKQAGAQ
ncbi:hypothetical protein E3P99_02514 [Wallemia hederae]|uniref:2-(3-amino-3-carboxypropyl)histidine synthase subunit 2 n=1 Tax=Wallemia hederae TaxID=1540922 RepID=A0A4T0FP37_9BASI|nr:hypothetical protein E3P99_02514 [Wallemia hederae]